MLYGTLLMRHPPSIRLPASGGELALSYAEIQLTPLYQLSPVTSEGPVICLQWKPWLSNSGLIKGVPQCLGVCQSHQQPGNEMRRAPALHLPCRS